MPKSKLTRAMICALTVVALFGTVQSGGAKARPTYDQAWALCTKHLDQAGIRKDASAHPQVQPHATLRIPHLTDGSTCN